MTDTTVDDEDIVRLAIGGRKVRRERLSQLALARLLGLKKGEQEDDEGEDDLGEEGGDLERRLARLVIGKGVVRRARLRKLLLARLLRERAGEGEEEEGEGEGEESTGEDGEHNLVRLLIGKGIVRRARLRRLLLAHLLRQKGGEEEEGESEEGTGEDGDHEDRRLVRLLIGKGVANRARLRRLLLAQLVRGREESVEE